MFQNFLSHPKTTIQSPLINYTTKYNFSYHPKSSNLISFNCRTGAHFIIEQQNVRTRSLIRVIKRIKRATNNADL